MIRGSSEGRGDATAFRAKLVQEAVRLRLPLSDGQAEAMTAHYRILRTWGRRMNLTGLRDRDQIMRRHFLEPICAADLFDEPGRLLDVGSGNGFPAVPIKVMRPELDLILVEASERKSGFLWAVLRELGLKGARVETRRVQGPASLSDLTPCRYLTARAIRLSTVLGGEGRVDRLLQAGGRAVLFLSAEDARAIGTQPPEGLRLREIRRLVTDPGAALAVFEPA